jgi:Cu/Ag efflux pump CusA
VEVNPAAAAQYGIGPGDVRRAPAAFAASEEAGDVWRNGKDYEVHVWSMPQTRNSISAVQDLLLDADGRRVRLGDLATVKITPTANVVVRENGSRRIDIGANVRGRDLGSVVNELQDRLAKVDLPRGYHAEVIGEYKERQSAQRNLLIFAIVAAVGILLINHFQHLERHEGAHGGRGRC